jgi:hypothetical protein
MHLILGRILPESALDFTDSISPIHSSKGGGPKKGSRFSGLALLDPGPPPEQDQAKGSRAYYQDYPNNENRYKDPVGASKGGTGGGGALRTLNPTTGDC